MIPLDRFDVWAPRMDSCAEAFLNASELAGYQALPSADRRQQLQAMLEAPIRQFSAVNTAYFRARWGEVLRTLRPTGGLSLLEVAAGDADMIPQAMARTHPGSLYVTANQNVRHNESMRSKLAELPLAVRLVEDDAANIGRHLDGRRVDLVAFQHGINDVIQAILCDRVGIDTVDVDWMQTLPRMIELIQQAKEDGTLERHARPGFVSLVRGLLDVLAPGGCLVANHYLFQLDLDWGYPRDVFESFVPLARHWLADLPDCREIRLDGFDPQWWLFLQKR